MYERGNLTMYDPVILRQDVNLTNFNPLCVFFVKERTAIKKVRHVSWNPFQPGRALRVI